MAKIMSADLLSEMKKRLTALQDAFPYTEEGCLMFANYAVNKLIKGGPDLTESQKDIVRYLFHNGMAWKAKKIKRTKLKRTKRKEGCRVVGKIRYKMVKTGIGRRLRMIQANRGLGKTTLCAIYAVFRLIHDPTTRVLIFSAGGKLSKEIANWIIQIIEGLEILNFMRPDKHNGDRCSVESYDVHWALRGAEKSPSVKCLGVDSNAQGSRADLLIADDIESMKNSRTVMMRELLIELTKEFESICSTGDIVYLGTPQFYESIYNGLPSRGFDMRIWPARYPNEEQLTAYGNHLAPMLLEYMEEHPECMTGYGLNGKQGAPVTPEMFPEELLLEKELSQESKFQLQYMLNTRLADSDRYPLKICNLIVAEFSETEGPRTPIWCNDPREQLEFNLYTYQQTDKFFRPMSIQGGYAVEKFERSIMYIDPAGGGKNGDEIGYACIRLLGSYVYLIDWGGIPGGYEEANLMKIVKIAKKHGIKELFYEKNFGNGAHAAVLKPLFEKEWPCTLTEHWATGQKELRIIDTIEPLLSSHRLVVHPDVIRNDLATTQQYGADLRKTYSGFFQMSMITRDAKCLVHDDRLDALAGAIYQVTKNVDFSHAIEMEKREKARVMKWLETWKKPHQYKDEQFGEEESYDGDGILNSNFGGRAKWAA